MKKNTVKKNNFIKIFVATMVFCFIALPMPIMAASSTEIFTKAVSVLQMFVVAIGAGLCVWGGINLAEGYGGDNPANKSQGIKQLMAGMGVAAIGMIVVPLLSTTISFA